MTNAFAKAYSLNLGAAAAPRALTIVLNLGCTDSHDWFNANIEALDAAIAAGRVQAQLVFWNKQKPALANGNVANGYIDYQHPDAAFKFVRAVFANQEPLRAAADPAAYLEQTYGVTRFAEADAAAKATADGVANSGVNFLPTVIDGDVLYSDEKMSELPEL
jgi:hypothetical protein